MFHLTGANTTSESCHNVNCVIIGGTGRVSFWQISVLPVTVKLALWLLSFLGLNDVYAKRYISPLNMACANYKKPQISNFHVFLILQYVCKSNFTYNQLHTCLAFACNYETREWVSVGTLWCRHTTASDGIWPYRVTCQVVLDGSWIGTRGPSQHKDVVLPV